MGMSLTGCPPMDDSDGDGIPDSSDLCPHVPGPFPLGCSDAGMDSDGDAVPDIMDLCPTAPGLPPYGCPDSDGDGVVDALDQCPGHDDNQDADGNGTPDGCDPSDDDSGTPADPTPPAQTPAPPAPGPDMVYIPDDAVMGTFIADTSLHFAPRADALTGYSMRAGQSLWVYGQDASGQYYQVLLSGRLYWVPASQVSPTYTSPWNGHPLPGAGN